MLITDLATPSPCYGLQQALHQVWCGIPSMHNTNPVSSKIPFLPPGPIKTQYFLTNQKMRNCGPDRPAFESSRGQLLRSRKSKVRLCAAPQAAVSWQKGGGGESSAGSEPASQGSPNNSFLGPLPHVCLTLSSCLS